MKDLELTYGCKILVTHVAGTIMITQGTDGILHGQMNLGVTCGENMLKHCPWSKSAINTHPKLLRELKSWF